MLQVTSREAELAEKLISKQRQCDLLMLEISELAAQLAETNHFDDEGFNSPTDWMRFKCHLSEKAAADRIAVGRMAPKLAESVQALQAGEIGFAHLATMARTVEHVGRHADLDGLLELARKMTPGKFFYECQHYRHSVDAKGYCDDQSDQAVNHHLTLSTAESGHLLINGVLDPVGGAAVRTALEPLAQPSGAHDDRLLRQRFADALVELASAGKPANLQVTATIETLKGLAGGGGGGDGVLVAHLLNLSAAHGLRLQRHPGLAQPGLGDHRRRPQQARGLQHLAQGPQDSRRSLPLARL